MHTLKHHIVPPNIYNVYESVKNLKETESTIRTKMDDRCWDVRRRCLNGKGNKAVGRGKKGKEKNIKANKRKNGIKIFVRKEEKS